MLRLPLIPALLVMLIIMSAAGCGYHNPYVPDSGAKAISIHRSMWRNQTNELGLETVMYHSLSDWLRKTPLIALKEQGEIARYKLTGKITSADYPEISYGGNNMATELRAILTVEYRLIDTDSGTIILETAKTYTEPFKQSTNPTLLQANKEGALAEIADNISEEIYRYLITKVMRK